MCKTIILMSILFTAATSNASDDIKLEIANMVRAAEIKYALPENLLSALILIESNGNHKAKVHNDGVSKNTSYGLVQIQLDSARHIQKIKSRRDGVILYKRDLVTPAQLMNPEINIDYGAAYLKWILENHKNDVAWALSCYNAGPNSFICKNKKYSQYVGLVLNAYIKKVSE